MTTINKENNVSKFTKYGLHLNPFVFFVSAGLIVIFLIVGFFYPAQAGFFAKSIQNFLATYLGWFYILAVGFFLMFVIYLFFSPYSKIRLGKDNEKPEFGYLSWFAMLFSAGMGIGLVFYGVAEPIMHYASPPIGEPQTIETARKAMQITFFHWGLHAWAIYIVMGLSLAYFCHRLDMPLSIRSAFYPLLGKRIYGWPGNLIDTFAVFGTMFGIATSLGLGVQQINSGMEYIGLLEKVPDGLAANQNTNLYWLIAGITLIATLSVISGLERGIVWLSKINIALALFLLLFVFFAGPDTMFIIKSFIQNTGDYLQQLITLTFWNGAYQKNTDWQKSWTLFYWAWWISWAPFVGIFVARISRGRTIREFIFGVLIIPTLITFFWLSVFGNTAIFIEMNMEASLAQLVSNSDQIPQALYHVLDFLPLSTFTALLATIVVTAFFVTSSDSGSLVIDIITAGGHTNPPLIQRVFWAVMEGAVAAILLYAGGLAALQTAAITTALPMTVIMLFMCWGLIKALSQEIKPQ